MSTDVKEKLDAQTIDIIQSTVPVLEKQGEQITKRFYEQMFSNHPELKNIFNQTHQKMGRQPKALAATVYAAASHIERLEDLLPVVRQIGHKHRSLNIKPEHYPIVGKHLLLAIKDVLGEAATDEIMQAWERAYDVIADVFIQVEQELYKEVESKTGGWKGFRRFTVTRKVKESEVITSFYLKPEDGKELADFHPGQYITVKCDIDGEPHTHMRQYSLSDAPGKDYYRISVKREDGENGNPSGIVSSYLHKKVQEGDILEITAPAGEFVLQTDHDLPVVLISGGVGITPMISMLNTLAEQDSERKVIFIHAARNGNVHAMDQHFRQLAEQNRQIHYYVCYQSPTEEDRENRLFDREGYIDLEWLRSILPSNRADFYFCGPELFMKAIYKALKEWDVPEEQIHYEFFGPMGNLE